jgi:hypothetical protein
MARGNSGKGVGTGRQRLQRRQRRQHAARS